MNQATGGQRQEQGDLPPLPSLPAHHQTAQVPAEVANPTNPVNPVIMNEYNSFDLANVTAPIALKWKNNECILDKYHKFQHSCRMIFDGPMARITSGKVKTNMFLIWLGPDGQDIYNNFNLNAAQHHI